MLKKYKMNEEWKIGLTEDEINLFLEKVRQARKYDLSKLDADAPLLKIKADERGVSTQTIADELIIKDEKLNSIEYRFINNISILD